MWAHLASTIGDLFEREAKRDAKRDANQAANRHVAEERSNQERHAKMGIQWKMQDARAAGISPLYALGASGSSYSPVSQPQHESGDDGGTVVGDLSRLGQSIAGAAGNTQTASEKQYTQLQVANAKLDLEGKAIDNQIRASQLRQMQTGPAFPGDQHLVPGQGNSGIIKTNPMERSTTMKGRPDAEPGALPSVGWAVNSDGSLTPVPSKDVKERIEDQFIPEMAWAIRNQLMPNITGGSPPPGYEWDYAKQAYGKGRPGYKKWVDGIPAKHRKYINEY